MINSAWLTEWAVWAGLLAGLALFFQPHRQSNRPAAA
jgi:hypothetical protein